MIDTTTVTPTPTTPLRDLGLRESLADPSANDLDKDAFLQLLVAQLRYQDPLNPNDPAEFMATTAQFTVVEKLDELTQQGANTAIISGLSMASSLVGRTVTYMGSDDTLTTGVVSSAQVSSGEVRLVTDNGIVDLSTVIGIGATEGQTIAPGASGPIGTAAPAADPETPLGTSEPSEATPEPPSFIDQEVVTPSVPDIPVVSTLPSSPLAIPPSLSSSRPEQPTTPSSFIPHTTDPTTQPPSNTAPASDTNTTKEFTS